jgi:hypothetical protein
MKKARRLDRRASGKQGKRISWCLSVIGWQGTGIDQPGDYQDCSCVIGPGRFVDRGINIKADSSGHFL